MISSAPLTDMVPAQPSAIAGRYVCQWDQDSVDDASFVKIDLLALGALSQLQEAAQLITKRTGTEPDLSRTTSMTRRCTPTGPGATRWECSRWSRQPSCRPFPGCSRRTSTTWPWRWRRYDRAWAPTTEWPSFCVGGTARPGITTTRWKNRRWSGRGASSCFRIRWCGWG